jgi:hypothetical protein
MTDKDIEKFCDKAFAEFKKDLLEHRAIPIMLIAAEVDSDNAPVFQLCTKSISCAEMIKTLHNAIKNCEKEMLQQKVDNTLKN